jgi:hypothetical protein
MKNSPLYVPSLILTITLTLMAALSLLPLFGLSEIRTFAPLSTILLLALAGANCIFRAERLKAKLPEFD